MHANDAKSCKTCSHWAGEQDWHDAIGPMGACNATIETFSATDKDADYNQFLKPQYKETTAFVSDASSYSATLYTKPLHFCSMWKGADGVMAAPELPELPEAKVLVRETDEEPEDGGWIVDCDCEGPLSYSLEANEALYTADQMREYARAALGVIPSDGGQR